MMETKKAFRKLPNLEQAITALSNLKGVGTTMASGKNTMKIKYSATLSSFHIKLSDFSLSLFADYENV
jgi:hypothetical protein